MKITRKINETKQLIQTIPIGSCFIELGTVFMRINITTMTGHYNAIQLETGKPLSINKETYVKPVEVELIVDG